MGGTCFHFIRMDAPPLPLDELGDSPCGMCLLVCIIAVQCLRCFMLCGECITEIAADENATPVGQPHPPYVMLACDDAEPTHRK